MRSHRESLQIATAGEFDIIDITADVEKAVLESGIQEGFAIVYCRHTTCGIVIQEKESGLLADLHTALSRLVPAVAYYRHNDWDIRTENMHPDETLNAHSHLWGMLAGKASECIPVRDSALMLGTWQRILVLEFDRAREREVLIHVCGD